MAKANWVSVNPASGSGNKTINVSGTTHTGRNVRSTTLTITAANVAAKTVAVTQQGKPEGVSVDESVAAGKGGQNVTIEGISNAERLVFSLGEGNLNVALPASYTAGGVNTSNGRVIEGDPGATAEFPFSIVFTVPANTGITEMSRQVIVETGNGLKAICLLTQSAGDATLSVSVSSIELPYTGDAKSFEITSNTSWTIS